MKAIRELFTSITYAGVLHGLGCGLGRHVLSGSQALARNASVGAGSGGEVRR